MTKSKRELVISTLLNALTKQVLANICTHLSGISAEKAVELMARLA